MTELQTLEVRSNGIEFDFARAKKVADAVADALLGEGVCLSWYDRALDRESPAHAGDCHDACDLPAYLEYAQSRGGEIAVSVDSGAFVYCYRPIGEFADA